MKVTLLDTKTMNTAEVGDDIAGWNWAEGGCSCDCNRAAYFNADEEMEREMRIKYPELKEHQSYCYGSNRFLIIAPSEIDGYTLEELNESYPLELVRKHLLYYKQKEK